jgi:hypothetical protein
MSPESSRFPRLIAAFAAAVFSVPAEARAPDPPACPPTVVIPGGSSPEDQTIHRCNLDVQPALLSSVEDLPGPTYRGQAHGTLTLVVDPDGRINAHLTRYLTEIRVRRPGHAPADCSACTLTLACLSVLGGRSALLSAGRLTTHSGNHGNKRIQQR